MRFSVANFVTALAIAGLAAIGGALVVYGGYDDSPGGQLIGIVLVIGAVMIGGRVPQRRE